MGKKHPQLFDPSRCKLLFNTCSQFFLNLQTVWLSPFDEFVCYPQPMTKFDHLLCHIAQWIAFSLRTQRPRVRFSVFPTEITYSVDVVEINRQQHCLVLSGQCKKLNNVDRTHLALQDSATKNRPSQVASTHADLN